MKTQLVHGELHVYTHTHTCYKHNAEYELMSAVKESVYLNEECVKFMVL